MTRIHWILPAVATLLAAMSLKATAQEKLTYNMSWLPQGSSVGIAVAIDQGWFKSDGLDVSMMRGYGGHRNAHELHPGPVQDCQRARPGAVRDRLCRSDQPHSQSGQWRQNPNDRCDQHPVARRDLLLAETASSEVAR